MEKVLRKSLICLGMLLLASFTYGQNDYIYGNVLYHNGNPMGGVIADLVDSTGATITSTTTNAAGFYEFTNVPAGNYTIFFSTDETAGGVTLTDAYLVMLHLWNQYPFNDFQEEVADVNNSGTVDWNDYFEIMFDYLNLGLPFSGGDWIFETREVTVNGSRDGWTTLGGSTGDVNGTFLPPKYGNCFLNEDLAQIIATGLDESIRLNLETQTMIEITGMHIVLEIPRGLSVVSVRSNLHDTCNTYHDGETVRVTWMNRESSPITIKASSPIIEIEVMANGLTQTGEELLMRLSSESHFIGSDGEMYPFVTLDLPGVKFEESHHVTFKESVYPNPFISYANLEYDLPSDGQVKILILSNTGQIINVLTDEYQQAGPHMLKIDGSELPAGIYHYAIQFNDHQKVFKTGSMIKSR